MKTTMFRRLFTVGCATWCLLLGGGPSLKADESPAGEPKPADAQTVLSAPVAAEKFAEVKLIGSANLPGLVLLDMAGQRDSVLRINVKPVDDLLRAHLGLAEGKGLVVTAVADDSALAKAGIRQSDVLLTVAGEDIASLEMLSKTLRGAPDKAFTIGIIRAGKKESVEIKPGSLEVAELNRLMVQQQNAPRYRLGIGLADADETLRSQLSLLGGEGLVVTSVETDSPAAKSGVLVNDVLVKLDGKALTSIESLSEQLQTIGDKSVALELMRRGQPATLTVTPEKHAPAAQESLSVWLSDDPQVRLNAFYVQDVLVPTGNRNAADPNQVWSFFVSETKPDLAKQVSALLQQTRQLQASLEALEAAIKTQPQPAEAGEEK